jgi:hypothetical protein
MPPKVDGLIPESREAIDEMGIAGPLRKRQVGGGASRCRPEMTTKLFVRGYITKARSNRTLARAAGENALFMWLSGGRKPNFRALSGFRGKRLKEAMEAPLALKLKTRDSRCMRRKKGGCGGKREKATVRRAMRQGR